MIIYYTTDDKRADQILAVCRDCGMPLIVHKEDLDIKDVNKTVRDLLNEKKINFCPNCSKATESDETYPDRMFRIEKKGQTT